MYIQAYKGLQSIILAIFTKTYQTLLDQGPNCLEAFHSQDIQRLPSSMVLFGSPDVELAKPSEA